MLFRDPAVGRHYLHDSPYTYFTSDELHLGEISLECSRAGAAAAALWLTLPAAAADPGRAGCGAAAGRRAALAWSELIEDSTCWPSTSRRSWTSSPTSRTAGAACRGIDAASARILTAGMTAPADPLFVSTLPVSADAFARRHPGVTATPRGRILRSVLMKPEHEDVAEALVARLERLAQQVQG